MKRVTLLMLIVGVLSVSAQAIACCMVPVLYDGDVDQSEQRTMVMHRDGRQEMLIQVNPFFKSEAEGLYGPTYMEWVITVPNKPDHYAVGDSTTFDEAQGLQTRLNDLAERLYAEHRSKMRGDAAGSELSTMENADSEELEIAEMVAVGPYEITAVSAKNGTESLDALNAYLAERGYPEEDPDHMRWFVENDFTFLCIHVSPQEGSENLGEALSMSPLHLSFASEQPYYPGMFSSQQGNFSLNLQLITAKPLKMRGLRVQAARLNAPLGSWSNLWTERALPTSLTKMTEESKQNKHFKAKRWYVNTLHSSGFNRTDSQTGEPAIAGWTKDVFFPLGGDDDLPPKWYRDSSAGFSSAGFLGISTTAEMYWIAALGFAGGGLVIALLIVWLLRRRHADKPADAEA